MKINKHNILIMLWTFALGVSLSYKPPELPAVELVLLEGMKPKESEWKPGENKWIEVSDLVIKNNIFYILARWEGNICAIGIEQKDGNKHARRRETNRNRISRRSR